MQIMPPIRTQQPTGIASLNWVETDDGSRTLVDQSINETYHSGCGAIAETLVVYLGNSGVAHRLRERSASVVLEYGFGTATACLLTAAVAEFYRVPLQYKAYEYALLPHSVFSQLDLYRSVRACIVSGAAKSLQSDLQYRPEEFEPLSRLHAVFCEQLALTSLPKPIGSEDQRVSMQLSEFVQLELLLQDASKTDEQARQSIAPASCDAIYFDPFSPDSNPHMWTSDVLQRAANALKPGGTLSSYCVQGKVRRTMAATGLEISKLPGPLGGKREVLLARKPT